MTDECRNREGEAAISGQWRGKHVSATTNQHAAIEELLEAVPRHGKVSRRLESVVSSLELNY
jgi:hypothetical protein